MFNFFKKKPPPPPPTQKFDEIRDLLFGDAPLEAFAAAEPGFEQARAARARGDREGSIAALRGVAQAQQGSVASRLQLQAWHFLREEGVQSEPELGKEVLGVVLEVQLDAGLDTLAAYKDHSARYINHGGKLIVWDAAEPEISALIDALIQAGQDVANVIGPWHEPRRGPPPKDYVRLNMLTRSGLHFGEGPFDAFSSDARAAPLLNAGTRLLTTLIARAQRDPS